MYGLQYRALAYTAQQAIKGLKITSVNLATFKVLLFMVHLLYYKCISQLFIYLSFSSIFIYITLLSIMSILIQFLTK